MINVILLVMICAITYYMGKVEQQMEDWKERQND